MGSAVAVAAPAIVLLGQNPVKAGVFVAALVVGAWIARLAPARGGHPAEDPDVSASAPPSPAA